MIGLLILAGRCRGGSQSQRRPRRRAPHRRHPYVIAPRRRAGPGVPEAPGARGRAHVAGLGPCPRRTPPAGRLRSGAPSPRAGRRGREHLPGSPRPVLASSQAGRACGWEQPWAQGKAGGPRGRSPVPAPHPAPQAEPGTALPPVTAAHSCPTLTQRWERGRRQLPGQLVGERLLRGISNLWPIFQMEET